MKNNSEICRNTKQIQRRLGQQHPSGQDNVLLRTLGFCPKGKSLAGMSTVKEGTYIISNARIKSAINTMRRRRRRRRGWAGPRINETQREVDDGQGSRHWERDERKTRLLSTFKLLWEIFCLQTLLQQHD